MAHAQKNHIQIAIRAALYVGNVARKPHGRFAHQVGVSRVQWFARLTFAVGKADSGVWVAEQNPQQLTARVARPPKIPTRILLLVMLVIRVEILQGSLPEDH